MNMPPTNPAADDAPLSPAQMLTLLDDQRRSVDAQMAGFVPVIVTAWGVAWLLGFGSLWLIDGAKPACALPLPAAIVFFIVLIAGAIAVSTVLGIRSTRGIRGNSDDAFRGTVYGATWSLGSLAIFGFAQGLFANGMDRDLANIFYPVAFVLFAGIMYVVSGAIWRSWPMIILGAWTLVVAVAAPFFGYPTHYLVLALAGGLGYLAVGILLLIHLARLRRRAGGARTPGAGARRG